MASILSCDPVTANQMINKHHWIYLTIAQLYCCSGKRKHALVFDFSESSSL